MLMSASSDFVALCREQIALLTQGLGASLSVVYLTQELIESPTGEAKLIPVVVYPETAVILPGEELAEVNARKQLQVGEVLLLPQKQGKLLTVAPAEETPESGRAPTVGGTSSPFGDDYLLDERQIVLPLVHEGVMMGLLVTSRADRPWNEQEQSQVEKVGQTLAIALADMSNGVNKSTTAQSVNCSPVPGNNSAGLASFWTVASTNPSFSGNTSLDKSASVQSITCSNFCSNSLRRSLSLTIFSPTSRFGSPGRNLFKRSLPKVRKAVKGLRN